MSRAAIPTLAAIALAGAGCPSIQGEGPYAALVDDDSTPSTDDDSTPRGDDDTTPSADDDSAGDDDTTPADDDTTPPDDAPVLLPDPDGSLYGLVSLSADLVPIFADAAAGCYCHLNEAGPVPGLMLTADQAWLSLVGVESTLELGRYRVVAGDPAASLMFAKVYQEYELFPFEGSVMPPNLPQLSDDRINLLYNWILQGAADN